MRELPLPVGSIYHSEAAEWEAEHLPDAIFSVLLGCLACHLGWDVMEQKASLMTWIRRAIAALLMIGGIACFSFGKIIG